MYEPECKIVEDDKCETKYEDKCETKYETKCEVQYESVCTPQVKNKQDLQEDFQISPLILESLCVVVNAHIILDISPSSITKFSLRDGCSFFLHCSVRPCHVTRFPSKSARRCTRTSAA